MTPTTPLSPLTLLKLGGSLITDKTRPDALRTEVLDRLAAEIAHALTERPELEGGLLIGHGSGSFGHVAARRHLFAEDLSAAERRRGLGLTQVKARELHQHVMRALLDAGVPAFSIVPSSVVTAEGGRPRSFDLAALTLALDQGLVPVVFGDVVLDHLDRKGGGVIFSTETVFGELVKTLPGAGWAPRRALWLGSTDGIYDRRGETLAEITPETAEEARDAAGAATGTDVTGGMAHRLENALALAGSGVESWIGNGCRAGLLERALRGREVPGTRVSL